MHISHEEFHCKYLEYFHRLHELDAAKNQLDDEETSGKDEMIDVSFYENEGYIYENELSAVQIRGKVMKSSLKNSIGNNNKLMDGNIIFNSFTYRYQLSIYHKIPQRTI